MAMDGFKGTPGPWRVDETKALGAYGVWTDYDVHPGHDGAGYPAQVCSVITVSYPVTRDREIRDANARLVAAAPDLLAAAEEVIRQGNNQSTPETWCAAFDRLVAAVAKARGE